MTQAIISYDNDSVIPNLIDIWIEIFKFVKTKDLIKLERVNKFFSDIIINCVLINREFDLECIYRKDLIKFIIKKYKVRRVRLSKSANDEIISLLSNSHSIKIEDSGILTDCIDTINDGSSKYLSKTKVLHLRDCNISDAFFKNLSEIRELSIAMNDIQPITNRCLINIPNYCKLEVLSLTCDNIDDEGIRLLTGLTDLTLQRSKVTGKGFKYLSSLKKLELNTCSSVQEKYFRYLTSLKTLKIKNCANIKAGFLRYLYNINILEYSNHDYNKSNEYNSYNVSILCQLWHNEIVNINNSNIKRLTYLTELSIANYGCDELLDKLYNLKSLCIYKCENVTERSFKNLSGLTTLDVSCCNNINDNAFQNLTNLIKLKIINCCEITDKGLENLSKIVILDISLCNKVKGRFFEFTPNIRQLTLSHCDVIEGYGFKYLSQIKEMDITLCDNINDEAFQHMPKLTWLGLEQCNKITDLALTNLCNLDFLDLTYMPNINGEGFRHLSSLSCLRLTGCNIKYKYISDVVANVPKIASKNLPKFRKLIFYYCDVVDDDDLIHLFDIPKLCLYYCPKITGKTFNYLKNVKVLKLVHCDNLIESQFKHLSHLSKLTLYHCYDIKEETAKHLSNIKRLTLCGCVKNHGIEHLSNINKLCIIECDKILRTYHN